MCPLAKINKGQKHIETVLDPDSYNSAEEAGRTKSGSMLVKSGCVQTFYSLSWEVNHRTNMKSSDSDIDILKVSKMY